MEQVVEQKKEENVEGLYEDIDPNQEVDFEAMANASGDDVINEIKDDADLDEESDHLGAYEKSGDDEEGIESENDHEDDKGEEKAKEVEDEPGKDGYVNEAMVKDIEQKEKELLNAKKQWQMTGEVQAHERPVGSLLEENLDFQLATKMPPVHTVSCIFYYSL